MVRISGSIWLCHGVLEWSPAPHEGLHYTKKHVLRVQVLFSVQYGTIQTSERLLNGLWVVLGVLRMVLSDLRGAIISCSFWLNKHNSKQFFPYELRSNKDERVFRVRLKTWIITDCMHTVHYHAITWCYLCSVNQYASFGTPQAYSGGNKKSAFFSRKTPITRDGCGK